MGPCGRTGHTVWSDGGGAIGEEKRYTSGCDCRTEGPKALEEVPLVYHTSLFAQDDDVVKASIVAALGKSVGRILDLAVAGGSVRDIEEQLWEELREGARLTMGVALGLRCRHVAEEDIGARGLRDDQVRLRHDASSWLTMMTTFGRVVFFTFA